MSTHPFVLRGSWLALPLVIACGGVGGSDGGFGDAAPDGAVDASPDSPGDAFVPDGDTDGGPRDGGALDGTLPDAGPITVGELVETAEGSVQGETDDDLVIFRGIPFADPPVGARRFEPAAPHPGWSDVLDATAFGPPCAQPDGATTLGEEDCLRLNVWAPREGGPRPVMVFIHGGAFAVGRADGAIYEGSALARVGDVVVVTIQYRLGALGWLTTEALAAESGDGSIGNYGLTDQIEALSWVERNIAAFGGDPDSVTVFGESAGGISICALLGTARADGLLDGAIIESGGGCHDFEAPRTSYFGRPSMMDRGESFAAAAGCDAAAGDQAACLRALDVSAIIAAQGPAVEAIGPRLLASVEWAPNVDGVILVQDPIDRLAGGVPAIPVMIGSNADEARFFTITTAVLTWANFENRIRTVFGADGDAIIALYPRADFARPKQAYDAVFTDIAFSCSTLGLAATRADGGATTHVYYFTRVMDGVFGALGAAHATELFFVWGNFSDRYTPTAADLEVRDDMQAAWTSFARTGAPGPMPTWAAYDPASPEVGVFDAPFATSAEIRGGRCTGLRALGVVP